jgi:hypothetical protein
MAYGQDGNRGLAFKVFNRAGSERKETAFSLTRDENFVSVVGTLQPDEFVLALVLPSARPP